jgi:hypothetical protein
MATRAANRFAIAFNLVKNQEITKECLRVSFVIGDRRTKLVDVTKLPLAELIEKEAA